MKSRREQPRPADRVDWCVIREGASTVLARREQPAPIAVGWFDDRYWRERNLVVGEEAGRGAVLFVRQGKQTWALRHYRRGGVVARLTSDRYLWTGLERTRAFREWRLLWELYGDGLPVPGPVAAHVVRNGPSYRCDIITERIADARSLAAAMAAGKVDEHTLEAIGATLRRFHDRGADHADLNAHNVLLDHRGQVYLVDFDRGAIRADGSWKQGNLNRLRRSLHKISRQTGTGIGQAGWARLERGYRSRA